MRALITYIEEGGFKTFEIYYATGLASAIARFEKANPGKMVIAGQLLNGN